MKDAKLPLLLAAVFVLSSVAIYCLQILFFHRTEDTLFYLFQDLAFLPINALLVVVILDKLMKRHEKQSMLKKMNLVIGVFFSEMGIKLLVMFSSFAKTGQETKEGPSDRGQMVGHGLRDRQKEHKKNRFCRRCPEWESPGDARILCSTKIACPSPDGEPQSA